MAVMLNREQRDAIREQVITDLTGLVDFALVFDRGDFDKVREMRERFEDDLALLDDLGWEPDERESGALTLPTEALARTLRRLRENATSTITTHLLEGRFNQAHTERAAVAANACASVLRDLDRPSASPRDERRSCAEDPGVGDDGDA